MRTGESIYFDNQASTPLDPSVFRQMQPYLQEYYGNPHSAEHALGWRSNKAVEKARKMIAEYIGADADEVYFTSGATESNNLALLGLCRGNNSSRRKILISSIEHKCILSVSDALEKTHGYQVVKIPVGSDGLVDMDFLTRSLDGDVFLVSIMAVNNEVGSIQPIQEISRLAKNVGAIIHSDAAQAPCAMDIDVDVTDVDLLSLSAHKMYGPKGIGAVYIRRRLQGVVEPLIYGAGQESGMRGGTLPTPLCVGMGAAVEMMSQPDAARERDVIRGLRDDFVSKISTEIKGSKINGPELDKRHPGNVNICFPGVNAQDLLTTLQPRLAASSGAACSSGIVGPSYVLTNLGLSYEEAESSIRFSLGRFTTREDVESSVALISKAYKSLRSS